MTAVRTDQVHSSSAGAGPLTSLWGRQREQSALNQVRLDVRSGRSRVLVVQGEPGIGKTALLEDLCRRADDVVVIRGVGIESESELAFSGLQQICSQIPREILELLSEPQRDAIRVALGLTAGAGAGPSPLLLGAAMLEYLAGMAEQRPVLVVIDDAQWLDRPTAQTLAFVARRLDTEALGLVFAVREQSQQLRGLPELIVEGLATVDARKLLASVLMAPVDEQVRERFIAETMGNPLAILELCHMLPGLTAIENASERRDSKGLWAQLEEAFERRIHALSPRSRRLSLIAAAEPLGDPVLMWRAADILQIPRSSADELEGAGLVRIGARVVFRHPLVRSVVYRHSRPAARRLVHEALAQAVDAGSDPEYRAWHRALAANGPDEEVAAELERSAGRATRRGGLGAAASFLERAVMLSEDVQSRGRRALVAAEAQLDAGQPSRAEALISIAQLAAETELEVAQREVLEARLSYMRGRGRGRGAPALLLSAATRLDALGGTSPRDIYHRAMIAAIFAGRLTARTSPMSPPLADVEGLVSRKAPWSEMVELSDAAAPHGFVIYFRNDVHPVMALAGDSADCVSYLMGNHTIAERMFRHDPRAMLYAPLHTVIWEDADGSAWFTADQPSTQFASFDDPDIAQVGIELDHKLAALLDTLAVPVPTKLRE